MVWAGQLILLSLQCKLLTGEPCKAHIINCDTEMSTAKPTRKRLEIVDRRHCVSWDDFVFDPDRQQCCQFISVIHSSQILHRHTCNFYFNTVFITQHPSGIDLSCKDPSWRQMASEHIMVT